jgi:hypothetical protein
MKLTSILAALTAFAILTGCEAPSPVLLSLEPVATARETAIDAALLGTWEEQGDKDLVALIRQGDHGGYQIAVLGGSVNSSVTSFQAQFFRVGEAEFLDLAPADDNDFRIPGHAVVRLWIDGSALRWAFLDSDWLKQQTTALATHDGDGKMQLFSPSATVRAFIAANGANDKAYGKIAVWQKLP